RVLPPDRYDQVVSGQGDIPPGASVPGGGPGGMPGMHGGHRHGAPKEGGKPEGHQHGAPKQSGKPGSPHDHHRYPCCGTAAASTSWTAGLPDFGRPSFTPFSSWSSVMPGTHSAGNASPRAALAASGTQGRAASGGDSGGQAAAALSHNRASSGLLSRLHRSAR